MRLETCRIRNLGVFRDFFVDLRTLQGPLVAIVGPNGAGKSTFAELFGPGGFYRETPTRGTLVDLATARDASLETTVVNGQPWTLRHLVDNISGKSEALVLDAAGRSVLPDTKVRSFDAWAAKHLPSPEVLFSCMFAPQGAGGFLAAKPTERKATVLRVLGVERLEALASKAKEHLTVARIEHETAVRRLEEERAHGGDVAALEAAFDAARLAVVTDDAAVTKAHEALEAGRVAQARADELKREAERRAVKRGELQVALTKAETELADVELRLQNNRVVLAEADAIRQAVADVTKIGGELAAAQAAAGKAEADARRSAAQGPELDERLRAITGRLERAAEALSGRDAIAAAEASLAGLEAAVTEADGAASVAEAALEDLRGQHVAGADDRIKGLRGGLQRAKAAPDQVAETVDETLGADDQAVTLARDLPGQVKQAQGALRAAQDRKAVAERALADARRIADRRRLLAAAEEDQASAVQERADVEARRAAAAAAEQASVETARAQRALEAELDQELEAARKLATKAEPLAKAEARIAEYEPRIEALRASVAELRAQLDASPVIELSLDDRVTLPALEAALRVAELGARAAHAAVAVAGERLEAARAAGGRLVALEAAKAAAELELSEWTRLAGDLGKDGLQAAEIDAAGPELTELVNDLLHTCHGPRFTVRVETQKPSADGKKLLEGCSVVVLDTQPPHGGPGREAEGETFSGGERVIIGEALSLALTMLACRRAGLEGITLVRDESGAALDPENARVYVAMLRRAAAIVKADKVLFVVHDPEIQSLADSRLPVGG